MAAITSTTSGNWADGGTWVGGVAPVDGDSVTVATTHIVTVAAGTSAACGTSPDDETTMDIIVAGTGRLVVNGTLTCKGNVQVSSGGTIEVVHTGSVSPPEFICDASHRPTTKRHHCRFGNAGTGKLILTGLDHDRRAYFSGGPGATWYHNSTSAGQGQLDSSFGYITRMQNAGDATNRGWLGGAISGTQKLDCSDTIFDDCGTFILKADAAKTITWARVRWKNTSVNRANLGDGGINAAAIVILDNITFDKNPQLSGVQLGGSAAFRASNNYSGGGWGRPTVGTGGQFDWTIKEARGASSTDTGPFQPAVGTTAEFYEWILVSDTTQTNPQISHASGDRTCGGYLYEFLGAAETGEGSIPTTIDGITFTLQNVLLVPNGDGDQTGTIASFLANAGGAAANGLTNLYHFTGPVSTGGGTYGVLCGETNDTPTGTVDNLKSLLVFDGAVNPPTAEGIANMSAAQASNDPIRPAGIDYNWSHLASCTTRTLLYAGTGGSGGVQSVPTAANDIINVDPQMVDRTRGMKNGAAWLGARIGASGDSTTTPGTAATIANFRLLFDNMWTGEYWSATSDDVANACMLIIQWVARGYAPSNATGRALGHDGKTAGYRGMWVPKLSALSTTQTIVSVTTNCPDGTMHIAIVPTSGARAPDFDQISVGKDGSGTTIGGGRYITSAISSSGAKVIDISSATLTAGVGYTVYVAHEASDVANGEPGQPVWARISETSSAGTFTAGVVAAFTPFEGHAAPSQPKDKAARAARSGVISPIGSPVRRTVLAA